VKTWKAQKFFGDLIYDMRNRGLLPLAALLLAAMVAVPLYLASQGSDPGSPPIVDVKSAADLAPENQAAVVSYDPGVRDYKERLSEQQEKNPFVQQFTAPPASADSSSGSTSASITDSSSGSTGTSIPSGSTGGSTGGSAPSGSGSSGGGGGSSTHKYFYFTADVAIGEAGQKPKEVKGLKSVGDLKPLPSESAPLVLFIGTAGEGKYAVFSVARDVVAAAGDGFCDPSPDNCVRMLIPEGKSVDLVYAYTNKAYRMTVRNIELVTTDKAPIKVGNAK
jgi:hypothetical protein